jgi:hypothetical protein
MPKRLPGVITILDEKAVTATKNSISFYPVNKRAGLIIRVNGGSGTQTLVGTFTLTCRNDSRQALVTFTGYTFTTAPAGSAWNYAENFEGMEIGEWQLTFTFTSGTGDIWATVDLS